MMQPIKAILFDLDDTLVQTSKVRYNAFIEIGSQYGLTITDQDIREAWGLPLVPFAKALYGEVDTIPNLMAAYDTLKDKYPTIPEVQAVETITTLLDSVEIGVVSSASTKWVIHDLNSVGFPIDRFVALHGVEESEWHKPHPDVFLPMFAKLGKKGITKHDTIYVGDSLVDFQAASGAGMRFYGLADRTTPPETFHKAGAKTINNLSELISLVDSYQM